MDFRPVTRSPCNSLTDDSAGEKVVCANSVELDFFSPCRFRARVLDTELLVLTKTLTSHQVCSSVLIIKDHDSPYLWPCKWFLDEIKSLNISYLVGKR